MVFSALYIAAALTLIPLVRMDGRFSHTEPKGHVFGIISGMALVYGLIFGLPDVSGMAAQALVFLIIVVCLSCTWSDMPYFAISKIPQWAGYCLLFLYARTLPVEIVLYCLYVPAGFIAAYGLMHQLFARDPICQRIDKVLKLHKRTRMYSTLGNPNYVGAYLAPQVFAGLYLGLNISPWFWAPLVLIVPALVLSRCRAAILSTILAFCIIPGCWPYVVTLIVAYGLVSGPEPGLAVISKKHREKYQSVLERFAYVKICWALIEVKPLFGWGPNAFKRKIFRVQEVLKFDQRHRGEYAHNDWLEIIVEFGLFGFALFGLFAAGVITEGLARPILLAGFLACLLNAGMFYSLHLVATALPFFVIAGLITGPVETTNLPLTYGLPLAALAAYLTYTLAVQPLIGLFIYHKFERAEKKDIGLIRKATEYSPYNSHYLATAAQAYHFNDPVQALHLHSKSLQHYDGEITEWSVWNNYARAAGNSGAFLLAERAFMSGLELDPTQKHLQEGLIQTRDVIAKLKAQAAKKSKAVKSLKKAKNKRTKK